MPFDGRRLQEEKEWSHRYIYGLVQTPLVGDGDGDITPSMTVVDCGGGEWGRPLTENQALDRWLWEGMKEHMKKYNSGSNCKEVVEEVEEEPC